MLLQSGYCQKWRDCNVIFVYLTVCQNQNISTLTDHTVNFNKQILDCLLKTCVFIISDWNLCNLESIHFHIFNFQKICIGQNRVIDSEHLTVLFLLLQKVTVCSDINCCRCYNFLTDCIDWWVCYLCKQLFKISEQWLTFLRKDWNRCIHSHRCGSFGTVLCHCQNRSFHVFIRIAKCFLKLCTLFGSILWHILIRDFQILQLNQITVQPFSIWELICIFFF